jgi:hypothetical protein
VILCECIVRARVPVGQGCSGVYVGLNRARVRGICTRLPADKACDSSRPSSHTRG